MEIVFQDKSDPTPVYRFEDKLEANERIRYEVPAKLEPAQLDRLKSAARSAFMESPFWSDATQRLKDAVQKREMLVVGALSLQRGPERRGSLLVDVQWLSQKPCCGEVSQAG